ncbi:MAG: uracil phosphoribosyltransferase [Bacteroidales bacterium]|nr:uracil phosphoribosyltransferase [Bacteroidales bacterium]
MIHQLGKENSLLNQYLAELRDASVQKDSMRFRKNLKRVSQIFAYEVSKKLEYHNQEVFTALGSAKVPVISDSIVIASLMRSGLAMHEGFLDFFDKAHSAFISIYRKVEKGEKTDLRVDYLSSPDLNNKILILADPMLATGISAATAIRELSAFGKPDHTHLTVVVASQEGIDYVKRNAPKSNFTIWTGAIDDELTAQALIVPGLGDAGDLSYGKKNE